jgi:hypothetical protein
MRRKVPGSVVYKQKKLSVVEVPMHSTYKYGKGVGL